MVTAAPPSRTLDEVMCAMADQLAQIAALLAQMSVSGTPLVYTLPGPAQNFHIWAASVGTLPVKVLDARADRLAFTIQVPTTGAIIIGASKADVGSPNATPVQVSEFGLSNHVGELWLAAPQGSSTAVSVVITEQWR
jgi:hypothetical protein